MKKWFIIICVIMVAVFGFLLWDRSFVYSKFSSLLVASSNLLNRTKEIAIGNTNMSDSSSVSSSVSENIDTLKDDINQNPFLNNVLVSQSFIEINLSEMTLKMYNQGQVIKTLKVVHKGPDDKWFRTPTGYFNVISISRNHFSSRFPVYMPYSVQFYEDFFIHGIPYYENGERTSSTFTGGCLRLEDEDAKQVYEFAKIGMPVIVFNELDCSINNTDWQLPVKCSNVWIRQNFNSPLKTNGVYYQHTALDIGTDGGADVLAAANGKVAYLKYLGSSDHGFGNTVILEHDLEDGSKIYTLYGHLDSFSDNLALGQAVLKGEVIGRVGASGYGCNHFWRIGKDGCDSAELIDYHLHFEIKKEPVLENPIGGEACLLSNEPHSCYGYTPSYSQNFGYLDPVKFIQTNDVNLASSR